MKIQYTWHEIGEYAKNAFAMFLKGFAHILFLLILVLANGLIWCYKKAVGAIRSYPCVAMGITFFLMLFAVIVTYAQMKTRLTTAEWQRDSLEQKIDSINVLNNPKAGYYRYQSYK